MKKITFSHCSPVYGASLLLTAFSLSLISVSVNAAISTDCPGRATRYCTSKVINADTEGYIDKSPVIFMGDTSLTVSASKAFNNKGTYEFRENTHVKVNADSGLNGGTYTLRGGSTPGKVEIDINASSGINNARLTALAGSNGVVNANTEKAINGGSQIFNAGTTLNINAADGVFNITGLTFTDATLNLNASDAFSKNTMSSGKVGSVKGTSTVNINATGGMPGGQLNIQDSSEVNVTGNGSVTGGTLLFTGSSVLNADTANAIAGETNNTNKQIFQSGTTMNVNAATALSGGNQTFNDATLNVNASQGISGGYQILAKDSVLNTEADQAIIGGQIKLQDNAVFNANGKSAITGGTQNFIDNSVLNATGGDTLSGGSQNFSGNSILNGSSKGTITGNSRQVFSESAVFNAGAGQALNGGSSTTFKDNTVMNVSAQQGVNGGNLLFDGNAQLNLNAAEAIKSGAQRFKGKSVLNASYSNTLAGGTQNFTDESVFNADVTDAVVGEVGASKQTFQSGTTMNVNATAALNGGNQIFNDATLNVNASQGISGGYQILAKSSVLNSGADQAVIGGQIKLQDSAVFNANGNSTVIGGTQNFNDNSILNANSQNTLSGGNQNFSGKSILNGNSKGTITGNSKQIFSNDSAFNASVSQAVTGGSSTTFKDNAVMNISAQNGVDGGNLLFDGKSTLNINTDDAIKGGEQRFKGDSLINLNHENSLYNATLKLEGNSSINVNAANALNYTDHIVFSKTYDTTTGSTLDVKGHSLTVGSIIGNDTNAVIKNSSVQDAILTTGLYDYGVFAGQNYQYDYFLQRGAMRADAVVSSALGDITRQAGLALIPQFADRLVPEPSGMAQNGQGVWVRTLYGQQENQGNGATKAAWRSHVKGIQIGTDLWPADEDSSHKLGLYVGYLDSNADVSGKTIYTSNAQIGNYQFNTYGTGLYWRYTATQGWYANTTLQLTRYSGQTESKNSTRKPDIHGQGQILAFEAGYPQVLNETLIMVPRISVSWQKVKLDDYHYDDLNVSNDLDNQLTASAGVRLYWNTMSVSGIQWSPFLDAEMNNQLTTRDRNNVTVASTGYKDSLLTSWNGSAAKISGGVTVKLNDYTNYYIKVDYQNGLSERSENTWQGTTGVSLYW